MIKTNLIEILEKNGLRLGRMISSSKSLYHRNHPFNKIFFNACIFELDEGMEIWYGDIDINDEETFNSLVKSAIEYKKPFLLTIETPYRFSGKLQIGIIINSGGIKFINTKYGWIGGGDIKLSNLSEKELDSFYNAIDLAVATEETVEYTTKNFDKILFSIEDNLTEDNEYGDIDYIKSGIKILSKFIVF